MSILKAAGLTALPIFGASISDRIFSCRVNQIDEWYNVRSLKLSTDLVPYFLNLILS